MSEHFRAFSFVDRITWSRDHGRIEGSYVIPSDLSHFPSSLAAEAVGQLAAWATMSAADFQSRPVAGLAGKIDLFSTARPGQVLRLVADIESLDSEAVAYRGSAAVGNDRIVSLEECVGPMIPVADLDSPTALRERFAMLCGPGSAPGGFRGLPPLVLHRTDGKRGVWVSASFQVPAHAALFADHFPRRPVFPGSLLVQLSIELATTLSAEIAPPASGRWRLQSVRDVKLREFVSPGTNLKLSAELKHQTADAATLKVTFDAGGEVVGSGRVILVPAGCE